MKKYYKLFILLLNRALPANKCNFLLPYLRRVTNNESGTIAYLFFRVLAFCFTYIKTYSQLRSEISEFFCQKPNLCVFK